MREITREYLLEEYVNNRRNVKDIAKEAGCTSQTIYSKLRKFNIKLCKRNWHIDIGDKFEKFTIIEHVGNHKNGAYVWMCSCCCGGHARRTTAQLKGGKNLQCHDCYCKIRRDINPETGKCNSSWCGHGDLSGDFFSRIRYSAKRRKIAFDLSISEAWDLYVKQDNKCFYSDLDITLEQFKETASLDRKNSYDHYHLDNVVWCHKDINKIKSEFSIDEFVEWCDLISNYNKAFKHKNIDISIYGSYFKDLMRNAKRRGKDFNITTKDILKVFQKQGGVCAMSGVELTFPQEHSEYRKRSHTASVDRIDNTIGYAKDNIQIVHKKINQSRKNLTIEAYLDLCNAVTKKNN